MAFPLNRMAMSKGFQSHLLAAEEMHKKLADTGPTTYSHGLPSEVPGSSMQRTAAAGEFAQDASDPKNGPYFKDFLNRLAGFNAFTGQRPRDIA